MFLGRPVGERQEGVPTLIRYNVVILDEVHEHDVHQTTCCSMLVKCTASVKGQRPVEKNGSPELLIAVTLDAREKRPLGLMSTFLLTMHSGE